jgi:hypothetical protein
LINRYFARVRDRVFELARREEQVADYQRHIDQGEQVAETPAVPEFVLLGFGVRRRVQCC